MADNLYTNVKHFKRVYCLTERTVFVQTSNRKLRQTWTNSWIQRFYLQEEIFSGNKFENFFIIHRKHPQKSPFLEKLKSSKNFQKWYSKENLWKATFKHSIKNIFTVFNSGVKTSDSKPFTRSNIRDMRHANHN